MAQTARSARRRWSREISSLVDGIAFGGDGPVLLHGYDPPAGGKWLDDVIPGKLGALSRQTGEIVWFSPCEVGYGRGFGAGFGGEGVAVVLGPGQSGHTIVRMSMESGELLGARSIEPFDEALVAADLCVCITAGRISGISTTDMVQTWSHACEGERYHIIGRAEDRVFVVYTIKSTGHQGVLALDAETGQQVGVLLEPRPGRVHGLVAGEGAVVILLEDLASALPPSVLGEWMVELTEAGGDPLASCVSLLALSPTAIAGDTPLWFEPLSDVEAGDLPDVDVTVDSGRVYVARGVLLEVRDALTGRRLGDLTVPGLDERVAWTVASGAGLLAEETRVSIFEIPD